MFNMISFTATKKSLMLCLLIYTKAKKQKCLQNKNQLTVIFIIYILDFFKNITNKLKMMNKII